MQSRLLGRLTGTDYKISVLPQSKAKAVFEEKWDEGKYKICDKKQHILLANSSYHSLALTTRHKVPFINMCEANTEKRMANV